MYWWNKKWNPDKICGITHSRLRPGKNKNGVPYVLHLNCKHSFYTNPLLEWVKKHPNNNTPCPICRQPFTFNDLVIIASK